MNRAAALIAGGALVVAIAIGSFSSGAGPAEEERPGRSARDPSAAGLHGWHALLEAQGREVELEDERPADAGFDPGATVVLLDPGAVAADDARALERFVEEGGRLVIGGAASDELLSQIAGTSVRRTGRGSDSPAPLAPSPELSGVSAIAAAGDGSFSELGAALPLAGAEHPVLARTSRGRGTVVLLADASIVANGRLASAGNARLALNLAGEESREVVFADRIGVASATGFAALPETWRWAALGLLVAALLLVAARARRLGPPQAAARELQPPRRDYVDAVAGALARSRGHAASTARLREFGRERLARIAAAAGEPRRAELEAAGRRAGLADEEIEALLSEEAGEDAMLAAAAAAAKLTRPSQSTEVRG